MIVTTLKRDTTSTVASGILWQYDYGQKLQIKGLDLPPTVEVHFALKETDGDVLSRIGTTKDGVTEVAIPDSMLEGNGATFDYKIYAFVYVTDETSGETVCKFIIPVTSRPKPNTIDTPEEEEAFRSSIAYVLEVSIEEAKKEVTPYVGENGNWFVDGEDTGNPSRGENGYTPQKNVDYFDGKDGADGITPQKGVDYFDGQDGRTPVKGKDYFTEEDKEELVCYVVEKMPEPVTSWNDLTDKPFYSKCEMVELSPEVNVDRFDNGEIPLSEAIILGDSYTIMFDGTEYVCVAEIYEIPEIGEKLILLGNLALLTGTGDTGEPFAAAYRFSESEREHFLKVAPLNYDLSNGYLMVAVYHHGETIKPLDEKFLPPSVARTTDVEEMISEAITGAIGGAY